MFPVAILAGGLATRLRPITETIPKALVAVAGEPFVAHQLRLLAQAGLTDVVFCVGYLGEMIEAFVGDGSAFGVRARYSHDGPTLLGTGGALKRALPLLGDRFFVLYGDSYLPMDYRAAAESWVTSRKAALMTVFRNDDAWDRSNVWFEDGILRKYSKAGSSAAMRHIDYGLSLFCADVFETYAESTPFDLATVQELLVTRGELAGFEVFERFYEIGSPEGLAELEAHLCQL